MNYKQTESRSIRHQKGFELTWDCRRIYTGYIRDSGRASADGGKYVGNIPSKTISGAPQPLRWSCLPCRPSKYPNTNPETFKEFQIMEFRLLERKVSRACFLTVRLLQSLCDGKKTYLKGGAPMITSIAVLSCIVLGIYIVYCTLASVARHQGRLYKQKKEKASMRRQGGLSILFDFIMTFLTGGLWLIWVLIRYLRTHWKGKLTMPKEITDAWAILPKNRCEREQFLAKDAHEPIVEWKISASSRRNGTQE